MRGLVALASEFQCSLDFLAEAFGAFSSRAASFRTCLVLSQGNPFELLLMLEIEGSRRLDTLDIRIDAGFKHGCTVRGPFRVR